MIFISCEYHSGVGEAHVAAVSSSTHLLHLVLRAQMYIYVYTYIYMWRRGRRSSIASICPLLSALYRMHNYWNIFPSKCVPLLYISWYFNSSYSLLDKGAYKPGTRTHTHTHLLVIIHFCRALSSCSSAPLDAALQRSTWGLVWTAGMTYTSPSCVRSSQDKCWTKPRHLPRTMCSCLPHVLALLLFTFCFILCSIMCVVYYDLPCWRVR